MRGYNDKETTIRRSAKTNERIAYRTFSDIDAYLDDLYEIYKGLYGCPEFTYDETLDDENAFEYCRERRYFVLVVPYTSQRHILLERSFANNKLTWVTIGGSLRKDLAETFIDAADRHASKTIANLELGEIEPVAFLRNNFSYKTKQHTHRGIAFVGRIRNTDPYSALRAAPHSRGYFVPYNDMTVKLSLTHNQLVVNSVRDYLDRMPELKPPEFEVAENLQWKARYEIHDRIVKPMMRKASNLFYPYSLDDLAAKLIELATANGSRRMLDVACGENATVFDLAKFPDTDLVVGNDVSWSQVRLMTQRVQEKIDKSSAFILFTNHDARRLPFKNGAFDFALCKNVLHHMETYGDLKHMLSELLRVANMCAIVEIMDPAHEGTWGRMRHKYYMRFLHDAGRHFLNREAFSAIVNGPNLLESFEMATIRGVYQIALLANRHNHEH